MPRLTSVRPGSTTSCDLGSGHWRIVVDAVSVGGHPGLGLVFRYTPAVPFTITPAGAPLAFGDYAQYVLAATRIEIADNIDELKPVARVALERGTLEEDKARTSEAMNLFKNKPRIREETFQGCVRDAHAVISGYWALVMWFTEAERLRKEFPCGDARLVVEP